MTDQLNIVVHLRTLFDNNVHVGTISPVLFSVLVDRRPFLECTGVQVMGHLLGILLSGNHTIRLEIWDWTTCQKITVRRTPAIVFITIIFLPVLIVRATRH
jgi:hypothetical protein